MSDDAFERLKHLIGSMNTGDYSASRVDMDEVVVLTEKCKSRLPQRFIDLVRAHDSAFPPGSDGRETLKRRLKRNLDVFESYPEDSANALENEELAPTFSLNEKDKERVLKLCTDMRKIVFGSTFFDEPHKRRLLNRIAAIEYQVHQKKGYFDVILGGVNDVGEALGKFGTDIKPLTDRIAEIKKITQKSSKPYEQLPPPEELKQLPPPDANEDVEGGE